MGPSRGCTSNRVTHHGRTLLHPTTSEFSEAIHATIATVQVELAEAAMRAAPRQRSEKP